MLGVLQGVLEALITYHPLLTFTSYMIFLMLFVLTLRMRYLFKQFTMVCICNSLHALWNFCLWLMRAL